MARISAPPKPAPKQQVFIVQRPPAPVVYPSTLPPVEEEPEGVEATEVGAVEAVAETEATKEKQKRDPQHVIAFRELAVLKKQAERLRDRFSSWIAPGKMKLSLQALEMAMCDTVTGCNEVEGDLQAILDSDYTPTRYRAVDKVLEAGAEVKFAAAYAEAYAEVFTQNDLERLYVVRVTEAGKYVIGIGDALAEDGPEQIVGIHDAKSIELK